MLSSFEVEWKGFCQILIDFMYTEGVVASREMKMDLDPLLHESVEYPNVLSVCPQHFRVCVICNSKSFHSFDSNFA